MEKFDVHYEPSRLGSNAQRSHGSKITENSGRADLNPARDLLPIPGGITMKKQKFRALLKVAILASAAQIVMPAHAEHERSGAVRLATGQFITPTFIRGAVQQFLNPGLPAYPNFVAGEAVRSQLSPDGTTLAVITAGQNSLDKPDGSLDTANSTQYIFIYNVAGANKNPARAQAGDKADERPCRPCLFA
jgi:hypothetical protein